jgi:hypothetical protein
MRGQGFEILSPESDEFLIGDVPAPTIRHDRSQAGVLGGSRVLNLDRSCRFYRDVLGLAIYSGIRPARRSRWVFFLGPGFLEVSGHAAGPPGRSVMISVQVRDVVPSTRGWPRPECLSSTSPQPGPGG